MDLELTVQWMLENAPYDQEQVPFGLFQRLIHANYRLFGILEKSSTLKEATGRVGLRLLLEMLEIMALTMQRR